MNENRELYVDLQLDDWIQPDDDFPVGVTTWKILQEDWWQQSWIILNWKTTSWDYVRLIYANDGKLYYDPWTWTWIEIWWGGWGGGWADCNTKTFYLSSTSDLATANEAYDWYKDGKDAILWHDWLMYVFYEEQNVSDHYLKFLCTRLRGTARESSWQAFMSANELKLEVDDNTWEIDNIVFTDSYSNNIGFWYLPTNTTVRVPFTPTDDSHPTTKKYVDDWLALKQDKLIAWQNITIALDGKTISATIPSALIYKWNVTNVADLPSSWQTVWDTYFVEWADAMYSWGWNQWNYVGGTGISLTDYFNMTVNTSDDITEWSVHLFVTQTEKNYWNSKQDQLTAWANIQISNNVISATDTKYTGWDWIEITNQNVINNTAKFDPDNAGSLGQFLKKTNNGYAWADIPWWWGGTSYTAWDWIDITDDVISATDRFTPTNQWSIGQVLKKSGANTYYWANESWGEWNFNPENPWTTGQVLTKTATWYDWETIAGGEGNVKLFALSSLSDTTTAQAVLDWTLAWKMPIVKYNNGVQDVYYCLNYNLNGQWVHSLEFKTYMWPWLWTWYTYDVWEDLYINYNNDTVTQIQHTREERNKTWNGTLTEYNQLTPIQWVVYNITSLN